MNDFIDRVGYELEGKVDYVPQGFNFHSDGSVEGFESNNQDCECFDNCDCSSCISCDQCDRNIDNCNCDSCLFCSDCDNHFESCECSVEHLDTCENKDCNDQNVCDDCVQTQENNRNLTHSCINCDHSYNSCERDCDCSCECENNYIGEIVTEPIKKDQIKLYFENALKSNYESNTTCGAHQHISFKSKVSYMILTDEKFYNFYLHEITKWAKSNQIREGSAFWRRLQGSNTFCKYGFNPIDQIHMKDHYMSERYFHLNFCYNVDNRKTLEFRLLPAFHKKELILSGLEKQVEIVEKWLELNPNKWNLNKIELFSRIPNDEFIDDEKLIEVENV